MDRRSLGALIDLGGAGITGASVPDLLDGLAVWCVELLPVDSCAVLLADHDAELDLVAAPRGAAQILGLLEISHRRGPTFEAYRAGRPVLCEDVAADGARWPEFAAAAEALQTRAAFAFPLLRKERSLGAVGLFRRTGGPLPEEALELARAMAGLAAIGILRVRAVRRDEKIANQWHEALESRVVVQQAAGILAERLRLSVESALALLAELAAADGVEPPELAERLVRDPDGTLAAHVSGVARAGS